VGIEFRHWGITPLRLESPHRCIKFSKLLDRAYRSDLLP
jgi:hypothetical protein